MCGLSLMSLALWFMMTIFDDMPSNKRVLLILVDGCRWDYIDHKKHKGFKYLAKSGVKAHHLVPVLPANSYPNWYSLVTGKTACTIISHM